MAIKPQPNAVDFQDPIAFAMAIQDWRESIRSLQCGKECPCGGQGIKAVSCDVGTGAIFCRCGESVARLERARAFHEAGNIVSAAIGFSLRYHRSVSMETLESLRDSLHVKGLSLENPNG